MKIIIKESQLKKIIAIISESEDDEINVLFIGDSLSAGPGWTWNYLIEKNHPNWNVKHIVKGGTRTDWMLDELENELTNNTYDKVFIYGGTNDMFSNISKERAFSNIQTMINMVNESDGTPYVFIGYDAESVMPKKLVPTIYCDAECMVEKREKMIEFQKYLKNLTNAVIIPKIVGDNSWTSDSTHPHAWAHKLMANHVEKYIDQSKESPKTEDSFFTKLKKFIENPSEFIFGPQEKLKKQLISSLKNLNESSFKKRLTEETRLEFTGEIIETPIVKFLQLGLQLLGLSLPVYGVDGKFGEETEMAVKKFKEKYGLPDDGIFDERTKNKLIDVLSSKKIPDEMFADVQLEKTQIYTPEDVDTFEELMGNSKLTPSLLSKFKSLLEKNDVSYDDFASDVRSIGLDPEIAVQQLAVESIFFRPDVISCETLSPAGAMGLSQFIPSAWSAYGGGGDPCNVPDALNAYVKLMDFLLDRFKGRVDLALAGYNSGPYLKVYTEALRDNAHFSELEGKIPRETWGYVNNIIEI
jgi:peptidoglycan hydrolase-like protein with peptidoglycan-binding domain